MSKNYDTPRGARVMQAADALTTKREAAFGVVRICRVCGHHLARRRGVGRGAGMREGNKQRGEMYRHIKDAHPGALAHVLDTFEAGGWKAVDALPISDLKKIG